MLLRNEQAWPQAWRPLPPPLSSPSFPPSSQHCSTVHFFLVGTTCVDHGLRGDDAARQIRKSVADNCSRSAHELSSEGQSLPGHATPHHHHVRHHRARCVRCCCCYRCEPSAIFILIQQLPSAPCADWPVEAGALPRPPHTPIHDEHDAGLRPEASESGGG